MQIKEYLQITKYDDSIHVLCSLRRTQNGLLSFRNIPNFSVQDVYGTYTRYVRCNGSLEKLNTNRLKEIHPLIFSKTLESGTNKPVLCRAVDEDGNKEDVVIKLIAGERMNESAFLKEFVGSKLADKLGLNTPEPFIALVSQDFIDSQEGEIHHNSLNASRGKNYSTKYIQGLETIGQFDKLHKKQTSDALKIFAFDLAIQNPDRTKVYGKPNLFTTGTDLWVLDHEIAFSFLVPLIGRPSTNPWQIHANDMQMVENHVLYDKLKPKKLDFAVLEGFLDDIDDEFWDIVGCLLYTSPSPRDRQKSRMPSSA